MTLSHHQLASHYCQDKAKSVEYSLKNSLNELSYSAHEAPEVWLKWDMIRSVVLLRDWVRDMTIRLKASTVRQRVGVLRGFYKLLTDPSIAWRDNNPCDHLKLPKVHERLQHAPSWTYDEVSRILAVAERIDTNPIRSLRNKAIVSLLATTGIRSIELQKARCEHLDLRNNTLFIIGKGGKSRTVAITESCKADLLTYLHASRRVADSTGYIFLCHTEGCPWGNQSMEMSQTQIFRVVRKAAEFAGIPADRIGGPHTIRRSFATILGERGATAEQLRIALGHSDTKTSLRYVKTYESPLSLEIA